MRRYAFGFICFLVLTFGLSTYAPALTYQNVFTLDDKVSRAEILSSLEWKPISHPDNHWFSFTILITPNIHNINIYSADWVHIKIRSNKRFVAFAADKVTVPVEKYSPVISAHNNGKDGADNNRMKREHYKVVFSLFENNLPMSKHSHRAPHSGSNHNRVVDDRAQTGHPTEPTSVPEPTTMLLLGFGLIGLAWLRRDLQRF